MSNISAFPRLKRSSAAAAKPGIIHLGPGAFFRAFNAPYTAEAMATNGGDWGIRPVSLRSPDIRDKLAPQDYAYTSVALTPEGAEHTVIESINDMMVAPEDPAAVLAAMSDPAIKIVSLTVTEKGYCHNPATGALQLDHPDIAHDLKHRDTPRSAPGFLVYALALRHAAGVPPFTVLSCDNLPDNGELVRRVIVEFAREVDVELPFWIVEQGCFPATMVDRITPATTDADIETLAEATGYLDKGCVVHEPFRQWVIEDDFVGDERPAWDVVGAQFVKDVAPFETMKLRCLNGTHSTLAYLGYLAGHETIAETVADPVFAELIDRLWAEEIIPTVPPPEGADLPAYCAALKQRYLNPAIQHRTWQIAMDGSQKLPQRLLGAVADNLAVGRSVSLLSLAVAGWMRYVGGVDENGEAIDVRDPLSAELKAASDAADRPAAKVDALLSIRQVFDTGLAGNIVFRDAVVKAYESIAAHGSRAAIAQTLAAGK